MVGGRCSGGSREQVEVYVPCELRVCLPCSNAECSPRAAAMRSPDDADRERWWCSSLRRRNQHRDSDGGSVSPHTAVLPLHSFVALFSSCPLCSYSTLLDLGQAGFKDGPDSPSLSLSLPLSLMSSSHQHPRFLSSPSALLSPASKPRKYSKYISGICITK